MASNDATEASLQAMQSSYGQTYAELYHRHWWWRSREWILLRIIAGLGLGRPAEILDVGCGDGLFLPRLSEFGEVRGIEVDTSVLRPDNPFRVRIHTRPLGDPEYGEWRFDLITALDVLEHMEDDGRAVEQMLAMLKPQGRLLITVPAFMALWDHHDELNQHHRRYTVSSLRRLLAPRCRIVLLRYLFHAIFLPKLVVKVANLARRRKMVQHAIPGPWVNRTMTALCKGEYALLNRFRIPFGTSVVAVVAREDAR